MTEELKVVFTIDSDYVSLVDALGLDFTRNGYDLTIPVYVDKEEWQEILSYCDGNVEAIMYQLFENHALVESCSGYVVEHI